MLFDIPELAVVLVDLLKHSITPTDWDILTLDQFNMSLRILGGLEHSQQLRLWEPIRHSVEQVSESQFGTSHLLDPLVRVTGEESRRDANPA